jgi:hypothetical protein
VVTIKTPILVGPKWEPKIKNRSSGPKRKEGLPFKEIPTRNTAAGDWKWTRLQPADLLLRFQPKAGTNQQLDTCPSKTKNPSLGSQLY